MEFDSMLDEGFFSMIDGLDYEFDENDLFKIPDDPFQGTMQTEDFKGLSNFVPGSDNNSVFYHKKPLVQMELEKKEPINYTNCNLENKFSLEDVSHIPFKSLDSANVTPSSNLSLEFPGERSVKTEIERRDSISSDIINTGQPIVIDARIFLDSYNKKKEHVDAGPSTSLNDSKLNSAEKTIFHNESKELVTKEKPLDNVSCESSQKFESNSTKSSPKTSSKRLKLSDFVIRHPDKQYQPKREKSDAKAGKKRKYSADSQKENFKSESASKTGNKKRQTAAYDEKKDKSKRLSKEKKHKSSHEKLNIKSETLQKKYVSSVRSTADKQPVKTKTSVISDTRNTRKNKKVGLVPSTPEKKCKIEKARIKVEPCAVYAHSERIEELETLEFEPNVISNIEKENIDVKQSSLNKPKANSETKVDSKSIVKSLVKTEKPNEKKTILPETPSKDEFSSDRKSISTVKRESDRLENLKVEFTLRQYPPQPRLILTRIPDYVLQGMSVCTGFLPPKDEFIDRKPHVFLNPLHAPKARIVLKKLTDEELRSPARLLSRVKREIDENVSKKLRSQGKARDKDFVHRYCCQCKSLRVERSGLYKTKYCDSCGFQLIYLCVKCNEKHYVDGNHMFRHLKVCRGNGNAKPAGLDSIVLHRCTECTFKTTYTSVMVTHVKTKGHKADGELDVEKVVKREKARVKREGKGAKGKGSKGAKREEKGSKRGGKREVSDMPKLPRNKYAKLIINQNNTSIADITERYCAKCNEPRASKTRKIPENCGKCKNRLQLRCLKCGRKSGYDGMHSHLRSKCSPNSYKCAKCEHTTANWIEMQQHIWGKHINSPKKSSKSKKSSRPKRKARPEEFFHCELCTFQTHYKHNIGRHMNTVHKK